MRSRRYRSLWAQVLCVTLAGLVLAVLSYALALFGLERAVDRFYGAREEARYQNAMDTLEHYIAVNGVASTDAAALRDWRTQDWELLVYDGEALIFASFWTEAELANRAAALSLSPGAPETILFADGPFQVELVDRLESRLYDGAALLAAVFGCLALLAVLLLYHRGLSRALTRLSGEVARIGSNDLDAAVTVGGCDELVQLERNVDDMRRAIKVRIEAEQQAWQNNRDLVTSLSHDLRSPLTAMLGYLELICAGQYRDTAQLRQYAEACRNRALQLKGMSDEMFRYFLVYDRANLELAPERFEAFSLLGQMLGEHVLLAREQGLRFRMELPPELGELYVDAQYLQRLFDNLFSNLLKYADPRQEISICAEKRHGTVLLRLENAVRPGHTKGESSGIGVATCRRIMELLGGRMLVAEHRNRYLTELRFPNAPTE